MTKTKTYTFDKLYEMSSGISSKPEQAGHGAPFLSFSTVFNNHFLPDHLPDLMDTSDKEKEIYSIKQGDVFLTRTSETLDELGMSSVAVKDYQNASYSGFLKRIRPTQNDITYHKFMAFYLRSKLFRKTMNNNAVMTLRASLNEQIFSYLELILPPFEEQKKIGDFLFQINQKIELNNKINAELEAMAKLIYDYWFVQFDFPDENGKPYKSSGGKMVWNEELKREIPEGWEITCIENLLAKELSGKKLSTNEYSESGDIPIIDQSTDFICGYTNRKETIIKTNVPRIIFGDHTRILKLINFDFARGADGTQVLLSNDDRMPQHLFFHSLLKIDLSNYGYARHFKFLKQSRIILPSLGISKKFESQTRVIFNKIKHNIFENRELAELRDWLLPMLMNGQVTISEKNTVAKVDRSETISDHYQQRKVLAIYILSQSSIDISLGKVKFEKLLHLSEYHIVREQLNQQYMQYAAGPLDTTFTYDFFKEAEAEGIISFKSHGSLQRIVVNAEAIKDVGFNLGEEVQLKINALIKEFMGSNYEKPEIISTLYAVWNNRIIRNEMITDELLKQDFLAWDGQKAKYKDQLDRNLNWMRNRGYVPDGWGEVIGEKTTKKKN